jgi:hypothetical protein
MLVVIQWLNDLSVREYCKKDFPWGVALIVNVRQDNGLITDYIFFDNTAST